VGMLKLLFHVDTMEILGVHCFGAEAAEIVHIGQAIMRQTGEGNTIRYFLNTTFNYPTMAEAYRIAALDGINRINRREPLLRIKKPRWQYLRGFFVWRSISAWTVFGHAVDHVIILKVDHEIGIFPGRDRWFTYRTLLAQRLSELFCHFGLGNPGARLNNIGLLADGYANCFC